jgi:hypothetical protein
VTHQLGWKLIRPPRRMRARWTSVRTPVDSPQRGALREAQRESGDERDRRMKREGRTTGTDEDDKEDRAQGERVSTEGTRSSKIQRGGGGSTCKWLTVQSAVVLSGRVHSMRRTLKLLVSSESLLSFGNALEH